MRKISILSSFFILIFAASSFAQKNKDKKEEVPKSYVIYEKSNRLQITISKAKTGTENSINFDTKNSTGGSGNLRGEVSPPAVITNIERLQGSFTQKTVVSDSERGQIFVLKDVTFPFRARYYMERNTAASQSDDQFEVEFLEPGTYRVTVTQQR